MGLGGISIWQLLIVLAIVVMLFGTKRLRTLGSDLGSAVKGFRSSMQDEDSKADEKSAADDDAVAGNGDESSDKRDAG
jgi:sec-independent protein translocase protein TatA